MLIIIVVVAVFVIRPIEIKLAERDPPEKTPFHSFLSCNITVKSYYNWEFLKCLSYHIIFLKFALVLYKTIFIKGSKE